MYCMKVTILHNRKVPCIPGRPPHLCIIFT